MTLNAWRNWTFSDECSVELDCSEGVTRFIIRRNQRYDPEFIAGKKQQGGVRKPRVAIFSTSKPHNQTSKPHNLTSKPHNLTSQPNTASIHSITFYGQFKEWSPWEFIHLSSSAVFANISIYTCLLTIVVKKGTAR